GFPFGAAYDRYADVELIAGHKGLVGQGVSAEIIANEWGLSREDLDAYGARSQALAEQATAEGRFENEIIPVVSKIRDKESGEIKVLDTMVTADEGIRPGTTAEGLAKLKPSFLPEGKVTAGNSSQICDGASAALIMSADKAAALGLTPRARFHTFALAGVDPVRMLTGPIPATAKALEKSGLGIDDFDHIEVNEAFASVVLAWEKEHHPDMAKVNANGGAIALGHPLGGSGTKLMATMLNELERIGGRYGLQTMCEGGGMANATVIERLG
nr:thiolase family protein [Microthrixaceae bacterium]